MLRFKSLVIFASIILLLWALVSISQKPVDEKIDKLDKAISASLSKDFQIRQTQLKSESTRRVSFGRFRASAQRLVKEYSVGPRFSPDIPKKKLAALAEANGFELIKSDTAYGRNEKVASLDFSLSGHDVVLYSLIFRQKIPRTEAWQPEAAKVKGKGRLAVVIDDWGYSTHQFKKLASLGVPVTVAILPNLPYSGKVAQFAHEQGIEIIIHMPMEPHDEGVKPEKDTVYTSMDDRKVIQLLDGAIKSTPYAVGMNNHMGSKATEDAHFIGVVFKRLKEKGLFFLDSLSSDKSICREEAERLGIGFAERDIFLDNKNEAAYIKERLKEAAALAVSKGDAICIGHDRPATLDALADTIPEMKKSGIEFVRVSELARR